MEAPLRSLVSHCAFPAAQLSPTPCSRGPARPRHRPHAPSNDFPWPARQRLLTNWASSMALGKCAYAASSPDTHDQRHQLAAAAGLAALGRPGKETLLLVLGPPNPAPTACFPRAHTGRLHQVEHMPVLGLAASRNTQEPWQSQNAHCSSNTGPAPVARWRGEQSALPSMAATTLLRSPGAAGSATTRKAASCRSRTSRRLCERRRRAHAPGGGGRAPGAPCPPRIRMLRGWASQPEWRARAACGVPEQQARPPARARPSGTPPLPLR